MPGAAAPPDDTEKSSYAVRSLPYLTTALTISLVFVVLAQVLFEVRNPEIAWPFAFYTLIYFVYQAVSLPVNFARAQLRPGPRTWLRVQAWRPGAYPSVDIFLPDLRQAGRGTAQHLDRRVRAGERLSRGRPARSCSTTGPARRKCARSPSPSGSPTCAGPTRGTTRSPGTWPTGCGTPAGSMSSLRCGLQAPAGLPGRDAALSGRPDGRHRADAAVLPVQLAPDVGRAGRGTDAGGLLPGRAGVQGPVRLGPVRRLERRLPAGRAGRRRRLHQIPYAEDSHTGLDVRYNGYRLGYLPVALAAGVCPAAHRRVHAPAVPLVLRRDVADLDAAHVAGADGWRARLPYVAGWLWNCDRGLRTLLLPLVPVVVLAYLPGDIRLRNAIMLIPVVLVSAMLCTRSGTTRADGPRMWPLSLAVGWAQVLALWDFGRGRVMSWHPSRGPKMPHAGSGRRSALERHPGGRVGPACRRANGPDHVHPLRHRRAAGAQSIWWSVARVVFPGRDASREPALGAIRVTHEVIGMVTSGHF